MLVPLIALIIVIIIAVVYVIAQAGKKTKDKGNRP